MPKLSARRFDDLEALLDEQPLAVSAAELHGVISGIICGGVNLDGRSYRPSLLSLVNEGLNLTGALADFVDALYRDTADSLVGGQFEFLLLLPDEEESLSERLLALVGWVNGYLSGFGVVCKQFQQAPEELREMISDLAEIARASADGDATDADFEEVAEYVRIVALSCFAEFARTPSDSNNPGPILH